MQIFDKNTVIKTLINKLKIEFSWKAQLWPGFSGW